MTLPREIARSIYDEIRVFHGTSKPIHLGTQEELPKDNEASLLEHGFHPDHKGRDEVVHAENFIKNHLPRLLEQTADPEAFINSRLASVENIQLSEKEKIAWMERTRERCLKFIAEIREPEFAN